MLQGAAAHLLVQHAEDRPQPGEAVQHRRDIQPVDGRDHHPVAAPHAPAREGGGGPAARRGQLAEGEAPVPVGEGGAPLVPYGRQVQRLVQQAR